MKYTLYMYTHIHKYRRSGNFRVVKFSCFIIKIFSIPTKIFIYSTFLDLEIWNETMHTMEYELSSLLPHSCW